MGNRLELAAETAGRFVGRNMAIAGQATQWVGNRGGNRVLQVANSTGGRITLGAIVGDQFILDGAGREYISGLFDDENAVNTVISDIMSLGNDAAGTLADGAEEVATETVQIGWRSFRENIFGGIESIMTVINAMVGGEAGLGIINWARSHQNDRPPVTVGEDGTLVEIDSGAPDMEVGNAFDSSEFREAYVTAISGRNVDDMTEFTAALREAAQASGHEEMVDEIESLMTAEFNSLPGMSAATVTDVMETLQTTISAGESLEVASFAMKNAM